MSTTEELIKLFKREKYVREFCITTDIKTVAHYSPGDKEGISKHTINNRFFLETTLSNNVIVIVEHYFGRDICSLDIYLTTSYMSEEEEGEVDEDNCHSISSHYNIKLDSDVIITEVRKVLVNHYTMINNNGKDDLNKLSI
jgi:hypothetical protein